MPKEIGISFRVYTLPRDGNVARDDFISLLSQPGEVWVAGYGFTQLDLAEQLILADSNGVPVHLLLDAVQAAGRTAKPVVQSLQEKIVNGDVTLTSAGPASRRPSSIMHNKVMIVEDPDGGPDWCWLGSINFSESGWLQANTAVLFQDSRWSREDFIPWFNETRDWARSRVPQSIEQLSLVLGVLPDFESLEIDLP